MSLDKPRHQRCAGQFDDGRTRGVHRCRRSPPRRCARAHPHTPSRVHLDAVEDTRRAEQSGLCGRALCRRRLRAGEQRDTSDERAGKGSSQRIMTTDDRAESQQPVNHLDERATVRRVARASLTVTHTRPEWHGASPSQRVASRAMTTRASHRFESATHRTASTTHDLPGIRQPTAVPDA